ncbi:MULTISPECIES: hypothetical protein [Halomonas]|uniref:hypothetical protein n=1 Tax=Halomonas TaxID=2745 RepID=UPI001C95E10D|nr:MULTISPECIES: hypothetical protein [Halomonas]MBY6208746.1 hypothetical protein [Halomonas sp. DP3Y7-2]MBY6227216.1 hypothetical protein [Halomonas sp. DP3Y7-1]MCA0915034.1 hypothetical protein [Halomonas denitrificans]
MMTISSEAGRRLAKAYNEYREATRALKDGADSLPIDYQELTSLKRRQDSASSRLRIAGQIVGQELCDHGFHEMDGED